MFITIEDESGIANLIVWPSVYERHIHGTTEPETVGTNVSSGCIRMVNQDIAHVYTRAAIGTRVIVLS
jgi:lipoprotein-anchoring transpeptidase ErfK/SrfK